VSRRNTPTTRIVPGRTNRVGAHWIATAWIILLVGVSASAIAARAFDNSAKRQEKQTFAATSADVAGALGASLRSDTNFTASQGAMAAMLPDLTNAQFKQFYNSVGLDQRYPGGIGFVYFVPVPQSQFAAFAARRNADPLNGLAAGNFAVIPPGVRTGYCLQRVGVYRGGLGRAAFPPGYDACARTIPGYGLSPTAASFELAQDTGQFVVVPPIRGFPVLGFAMIAPVYQGGVVPGTVAGRRAALVGWMTGTFDPVTIIKGATGAHKGIAIELSRRDPTRSPMLVAKVGTVPSGNVMSQTVKVDADGHWIVRVTGAVASGWLSPRTQGLGVLAGGMAVSVLFFLLVHILAGSRARALQLVEKKTAELRHQALHDPLTGLPNRALILDRVEQMLARSRRDQIPVAALFIDLDNFKDINDSLGHAAGDELLVAVATRLSGVLRDSDTVGRLGGDEFVVLVEGGSLSAGAEAVAQRLLDALADPFDLHHPTAAPLGVGASIGIALGDRPTAGELLRDADIALYQAKAAGKHCYMLFVHEMQAAVHDRLVLEMDLRGALAANEFFLVYQPIFNLREMTVTGVEALLRWNHPTRGVVQPDLFIPLLEETGMIVSIGRWVLETACRQAADWTRLGYHLAISVNVSTRQLESDQLIVDVSAALSASGLDAASLIVEVTETALMRDPDATALRLHTLKTLGVRIAIDDFGTGYSSLAYLRQFPVDSLKIDRSFISGIADSPESAALMHTLVQLGKTLGLETLAEGIEESDQLGHLQGEQCDSGQGFLFARPLAVDDVGQFLDTWIPIGDIVDPVPAPA
jgi:diguanylate cyclase (GGDEF)-like protein